MQFKTIREAKSGYYRYACSVGRDKFFAFDYQVCHDPTSECVDVHLDANVAEFGAGGFWPDIQAGVRAECGEELRRGVRGCCAKILVTRIKVHDTDTTPKAVRKCLAAFIQDEIAARGKPIDPLRAEWLTSDVVALARGIHADTATDRYPILSDALRDAGCEDALVHDHLEMCPDHGPSCWVVEMILDQTQAAGESSPAAR